MTSHEPPERPDEPFIDAYPDGEPRPPGSVTGPAEYLGRYECVEDYLRSMVEPEVSEAAAWLLEHVDWAGVLKRFEGGRYRYVLADGELFRVVASKVAGPVERGPSR